LSVEEVCGRLKCREPVCVPEKAVYIIHEIEFFEMDVSLLPQPSHQVDTGFERDIAIVIGVHDEHG
jgi:hypothetical protein